MRNKPELDGDYRVIGAVALLGEGERLLGELQGLLVVARLEQLEHLLIKLEEVRLELGLGWRCFPGLSGAAVSSLGPRPKIITPHPGSLIAPLSVPPPSSRALKPMRV